MDGITVGRNAARKAARLRQKAIITTLEYSHFRNFSRPAFSTLRPLAHTPFLREPPFNTVLCKASPLLAAGFAPRPLMSRTLRTFSTLGRSSFRSNPLHYYNGSAHIQPVRIVRPILTKRCVTDIPFQYAVSWLMWRWIGARRPFLCMQSDWRPTYTSL